MSTTDATQAQSRASTALGRHPWIKRFRQQRVAMAALFVLAILMLAAVLAPLLAPHDPSKNTLLRALEGPSSTFLLGTDHLGRDVLSRLLFAARVSLLAAVQAVSIALIIGLPLGLASGYFGGKTDQGIMRLNDAIMAFPGIMLAVVIVGFLGPSLTNAMIAIGIVYAPRIMRVARGSALEVREEVYFVASRSIGCGHFRLILRHLLPNILSPLIVQITLSMGIAILAESSLSFLGLGVQPPTPSWGGMLSNAFDYLGSMRTPIVAVSAMITLTVLCFNLIGDGLRDAFGSDSADAW